MNEFEIEIEIEIRMKATKNGIAISAHILYANEIGEAREEAVINTVSQ